MRLVPLLVNADLDHKRLLELVDRLHQVLDPGLHSLQFGLGTFQLQLLMHLHDELRPQA